MKDVIQNISVRNFRSLADVSVNAHDINVLFGPNGSGKSTFLDAFWFVRDCSKRGVDIASSERSHGIGALWDKADKEDNITIKITTQFSEYEVFLGYSSGRIEPFVGERLIDKEENKTLVDRKIGSDKAQFYHTNMKSMLTADLREPEKLAFTRYLDLEEYTPKAAYKFDKLLHFTNYYKTREADLYGLKKFGSENGHHTRLFERGQNLWSVLRNIKDKRVSDEEYEKNRKSRYDSIISYMRTAFPNFREIELEPSGHNNIYATFLERSLRDPMLASGASDGHLQLLINLTALFSEGARDSIILIDEPETSLHPHAIAVFAEALKEAARDWNKQIFISTHSPVLISQFNPTDVIAAEKDDSGKTIMKRVSEMREIQDLIEQYSLGSLYMSQMVAGQSKPMEANIS